MDFSLYALYTCALYTDLAQKAMRAQFQTSNHRETVEASAIPWCTLVAEVLMHWAVRLGSHGVETRREHV